MQEEKPQTHFGSFREDLIEKRFEKSARKAFYQKHHDFFSGGKFLPSIHFKGQFPDSLQESLTAILESVVEFLSESGLLLTDRALPIYIHTPQSFLQFEKLQLSGDQRLPWAKFFPGETSGKKLCLILPSKITRTEEVLNTLRLVASHLSGERFFEEKVPYRFPYSSLSVSEKVPDLSPEEYFRIYRGMDLKEERLEGRLERFCRSRGIQIESSKKYDGKEFLQELRNNPAFAQESFLDLKSAVRFFETDVSQNSESAFSKLREKIFLQNRQIDFILPHELPIFQKNAEEDPAKFLFATEERLRKIFSLRNTLEQVREKIKDSSKEENPDFSGEIRALRETEESLTKFHMAFPFWEEFADSSKEESFEKDSFPFWICRNIFSLSENSIPPNARSVKKISETYRSSVFQKIYNYTRTLRNKLQSFDGKKTPDFFPENAEERRFFGYLNFYEDSLQDLLAVCAHAETLLRINSSAVKKEKTKILQEFRFAWKYAVSFIVVHYYYSRRMKKTPENKNTLEQFQTKIFDYLQKKTQTSHSYRLATILIFSYLRLENSVNLIRFLITENVPFFDSKVIEPEFFLKSFEWNQLKEQGESVANFLQNYQIEETQDSLSV